MLDFLLAYLDLSFDVNSVDITKNVILISDIGRIKEVAAVDINANYSKIQFGLCLLL
jgi:hypothetical protein